MTASFFKYSHHFLVRKYLREIILMCGTLNQRTLVHPRLKVQQQDWLKFAPGMTASIEKNQILWYNATALYYSIRSHSYYHVVGECHQKISWSRLNSEGDSKSLANVESHGPVTTLWQDKAVSVGRDYDGCVCTSPSPMGHKSPFIWYRRFKRE